MDLTDPPSNPRSVRGARRTVAGSPLGVYGFALRGGGGFPGRPWRPRWLYHIESDSGKKTRLPGHCRALVGPGPGAEGEGAGPMTFPDAAPVPLELWRQEVASAVAD